MPPPKVDNEAVDYGAEKETNEITPPRRDSSSHSSNTAADKYEDIRTHHKEGGDDGRRSSSGSGRRNSFRVRQPSVSAQLRNPLAGKTEADVLRDVDLFIEEKGLQDHADEFRKGALLARVINRDGGFEQIAQINEDEKAVLRHEIQHRWSQPFMLYFLVVLCAGSAIVQGMDQTAVNGAQVFYFDEFNITNEWQQGLLNGAPYLCSCLIGCWTNAPLNKAFGRRGTIFISCFISFAASFWMAAANTWWNLLIARFVLGFAVGAKSSTTPVYAAESAPKTIRGALTMQWQMWTAFGIMLGFVASVAFQDVSYLGEYTQWRWMLGSTAIPPFVVLCQVYFCPESPRWYMEKGKFDKAFQSFARLRTTKLQAARDMYYAYKMLEIEATQREGKNLWKEFFFVKRNRRAAQSSFFVMFMQQFCGVNVIAYYSTQIFMDSGFDRRQALLVSFGTGVTNWLFAIPALYTIDTFGRRNLLLTTFPLMGACLLFTGFSFFIPEGQTRLGMVATGIYLFMVVYSPGEGPVPFTYSAEAFPLYIRDVGMSFATATCWGFNFILSFTWLALVRAFQPQGAFGFYAAWNFAAFFLCYFFLPETKNLTLEELDDVFSVGAREHAKYYLQKAPWYINKHVLRRDVEPVAPLYQFHG
ncbi:hypothetical protein PV10_02605 [Exophiala mesophila]|uniref:Major facilitator superfamily (MFS) profile domain-containing protein n=1 Tax=Exophiala mesophila TaxID=212818 RepID=A0A0D1ZLR7_EXOME|nr:uncharacterized protein PV10_02605 [Exophiala mesophila]KIV94884.1 hypothetical protein PV10_02605 [Exophiala mesophila]